MQARICGVRAKSTLFLSVWQVKNEEKLIFFTEKA